MDENAGLKAADVEQRAELQKLQAELKSKDLMLQMKSEEVHRALDKE